MYNQVTNVPFLIVMVTDFASTLLLLDTQFENVDCVKLELHTLFSLLLLTTA